MPEWIITDQEIEATEKIVLPNGSHFAEDARAVIRYWNSVDVTACPGSGKTTVLLAKLKLLADRMPFDDGAGVCVLSHTNVAVNEIKSRLSNYTNMLFGYPNFIGTIQTFIDNFVTFPYLRKIAERSVQVVDDVTYAKHMLHRMHVNEQYLELKRLIKINFKRTNQYFEWIDYIRALYLRNDGSLCVGNQKRSLASPGTASATQYKQLIEDLMRIDGIVKYGDAYKYADIAVNELEEEYSSLFSSRFQFVFIDEYQDCDESQRKALDTLFDTNKCTIIKIGDADQAIYNSLEDRVTDWIPSNNILSIASSCRYGQEVADVLSKLKCNKEHISTLLGKTNEKPVLFVFDKEKIDRVIDGFVDVLEARGLHDSKGVYKAIGAVKKEDVAGLKIGSYWSEFDGSKKKKNGFNYWTMIDDACKELISGRLYKAENTIRKLICQIFNYSVINDLKSKKKFTITTIKSFLDESKYNEIYRNRVYELTQLDSFERDKVNQIIKNLVNELLEIENPNIKDIFDYLPKYFVDSLTPEIKEDKEKNIFIDQIRGRRIEFNTIHGVKGETHDATLYLETEKSRSSDLKRILPYFNVGKVDKSPLYDYSRKLAYVGMSRPRHLLCVAMQSDTYEKSKGVFDADWEVIDLRKDVNS